MTDDAKVPTCSLCGGPVEVWPGYEDDPAAAYKRGLYGNNPEPLAEYKERCCDQCNADKVIPARLASAGFGKPIRS